MDAVLNNKIFVEPRMVIFKVSATVRALCILQLKKKFDLK